jgi:hypothetical protein
LEVEQGNVLYLAGENPHDVRKRWVRLCQSMKLDADKAEAYFIDGVLPISKLRAQLIAAANKRGPFALVVIDTFAAYFEGDEENANVEMARTARLMRSLSAILGNPTVLILCHPVKNANLDNLVPRGGGAFLAEIDGNFVCTKQDGDIVNFHWQVKLRGGDFAPIPFKIEVSALDNLKTKKGKAVYTVTARPIDAKEREQNEDLSRIRQNELLGAMKREPGASLTELAKALGWAYKSGEPNKTLTNRTMQELAARNLVKKVEGGNWGLTSAGKKVATEAEDNM